MGGGKIKDATATPQDVMTGKVFYNNQGRQIGIKDEAIKGLKVLNLSIPKKVYSGTFDHININSYIKNTGAHYNIVDLQYEKTFQCLKIRSLNFARILGFEYDGVLTLDDNPENRKGKALVLWEGSTVNGNSGETELSVVCINNGIYIGHETHEYQGEFTSIEPNNALNLKVYFI